MFNILSEYGEGLSNWEHEIIKVRVDSVDPEYRINCSEDTTSFIIAITDCKIGETTIRKNTILTVSNFCVMTCGDACISEACIITAPKTDNRPNQLIQIPSSGAYSYIDGCTDSLLVPPIFKGDDCLNALYFPPNTHQTMHTHPSLRLGYILEGSGYCYWYKESVEGIETLDRNRLCQGDFFWLNSETIHQFVTNEDKLTVIAYHPDSDVGMTNENHPMLNRTVIDGTPANELRELGLA
jgi:quercetin dioxygenase-like cupin family protein